MPGNVDRTLAALADPARRTIVELLREKPLRASELADALGTSRSVVSRHLRVLRTAGLVADRILADDARGRLYRLRRQPLSGLRDWLDQIEAFWGEQLDAFRAHAERPRRGRDR